MAVAKDSFSDILAQRCQESLQQDAAAHFHSAIFAEHKPRTPSPPHAASSALDDTILDLLSGIPDHLETAENFDLAHLWDLQPEELLTDLPDQVSINKRKATDTDDCKAWKRTRQESVSGDISPLLFHDLDESGTLDSGQSIGFSTYSQESYAYSEGTPRSRPDGLDLLRPTSPCSDISEQSCCDQSVEHHFQKIQDHVKLAVDALKRGQYARNKNIVTWAHELKNKTFSEVTFCSISSLA